MVKGVNMSDQVTSAPVPAAASVEAPAAADTSEVENLVELESIEALDAALQADEPAKPEANASTAQKQEAVKAEVDKQMQKWILKGLNGENIEVSDVNDLVKRAQKGLGAELKFQEAAEIKKEAGLLLKMLNEDPLGLLEQLGLDTVTLSQQRLQREAEERAKSPEQKQRELELQELESLRKQIKEQEDNKKQSDYQRMVADQEKSIEEGMISALQTEGLPIKPVYIKRMAEVMQAGLDQGVELTPAEALKFARREVVGDLRELLDASPDEMLEDLIGSGNAKRLRKRYLSTARQRLVPPSQVKSTGETSASKEKAAGPKMTVKNWLKGK